MFPSLPNSEFRLIVITSRPHGYRNVELGGGFHRCELKAFASDDVERFIRCWYDTAPGTPNHNKAQELIEAIRINKRVAELATDIHPYAVVLDPSGDTLYVSNWGARSVSVIVL